MKRFMKVLALTLALAALPALSLASDGFGSAAVEEGAAYPLADMLTYALQDEYMAQVEYDAMQEAFGTRNPFANIRQAEVTHQELLLPLFAAYGVPVPANTAGGSVVIPETLPETFAIGVQAEINNIAMYEAFLAQSDLPDDVRAVFTALMNASQSHLQAFSRNVEKDGLGLYEGQTNGRGRMSADDTAMQSTNGQRQGRGTDALGQAENTTDGRNARGGKNRN